MNPAVPSRRCRAGHFGRGFTLLEMLLAVAVFGLLAAAAYGVLNSMANAASAQEAAAGRLKEVQLAIVRLERELRQTIATGMLTREPADDRFSATGGEIEFTYLVPVAAGDPGMLMTVRYRHGDTGLYRWPGETPPRENADIGSHALLEGVERLAFAFMDTRGRWHSRWPAGAGSGLPVAVRLDMEVEGLGRVQRLVELPGDRP